MKTKDENVQTMDEIVFENRNKAYGAYQLRSTYNQTVSKALLIATAVVVFAALWPLLSSYANENVVLNIDNGVELSRFKTEDAVKPPPLPPPVKPDAAQLKATRFLPPEVVDSVPLENIMASNGEYLDNPIDATIDSGIHIIVKEIIPINEPEPEIFISVEEMPEFPGGETALRIALAKNTVYPKIAQENNIEGKVFIRFVVTDKGLVDQVSVIRKVDPLLDDEALRVVKLLPKWNPGKQRGVPVNVWYTVPISFQLTKN